VPIDVTSQSLLPIHLQPKNDELLSSWLVRLSIAHVMRPDTFYSLLFNRPPRFPTRIDEISDETTTWRPLALATGLSVDRVKDTTLIPYGHNLRQAVYMGSNDPRHMSYEWVMPADHRKSQFKFFGLQYCPSCLAEGETPYFRRIWRLAFVTLCGAHRRLLLDRCTYCGSPVDFLRNASRVNKKNRSAASMTKCHSCQFDLRSAVTQTPRLSIFSEGFEFQEALLKALWWDVIRAPQGKIYSVEVYFETLHTLMELLAFGGFGRFIRHQLCKRYKIAPFTVAEPNKYRYVELLFIVRERFNLLRVARRIFHEWPSDMLNVSRHVNSSARYPPLDLGSSM
jgi:TniQ